jgi:hypothetical protein
MSVASYDTWRHFISGDVNLECPLQITTCGAACCYVRLSANHGLKIYSSVLVAGPSEDPERSPYGRSGWKPEEECLDRSQHEDVVQTTCPATPTAKRWVSWSLLILDLQFRRVWIHCVRGRVPDVPFCSPSLAPRGPTLTAKHLIRVMSVSAAKYMRTALFWVITLRAVVILYRRFGTTYLSHFKSAVLTPKRWHYRRSGQLQSI